MGKLYFKFKKGTTVQKQNQTISVLRSAGLTEIRRLFPNADDEVRSTMYVAFAQNSDDETKHLKVLGDITNIEYAESEKPKRPLNE